MNGHGKAKPILPPGYEEVRTALAFSSAARSEFLRFTWRRRAHNSFTCYSLTLAQLKDMPGWRADPTGGFIRLPPPPEPDPADEIEYGWEPDPDGSGALVRIPDERLPAPFRKGIWCRIDGLTKHTEKNGLIVEVVDETIEQTEEGGVVHIRWDKEDFQIQPTNLRPLEGSEKVMSCHRAVTRVSWRD